MIWRPKEDGSHQYNNCYCMNDSDVDDWLIAARVRAIETEDNGIRLCKFSNGFMCRV